MKCLEMQHVAFRNMLFTNNFHENAFSSQSVEFSVKDLLPRTEIQLSFCHGDDDLPTHDGTFEMGVGIVLTGSIVQIKGMRLFRCQVFEPLFEVSMQTAFIVINENAGGDVHRIDEAKPFRNFAFDEAFFHLAGDVAKHATAGYVEPKFLAIRFHGRTDLPVGKSVSRP